MPSPIESEHATRTQIFSRELFECMKRHKVYDHFIIRFDASPAVQQLAKKPIAPDLRVTTCGFAKTGERLKDIVNVKGTIEWQRRRAALGGGMVWGKGGEEVCRTRAVIHGIAFSFMRTSILYFFDSYSEIPRRYHYLLFCNPVQYSFQNPPIENLIQRCSYP